MSIQNDNKRVNALKHEFNKWIATLMDIQKYIMPTRGFFSGATPNDGTKINHTIIINSTATQASRTLSAGLSTGMSSASREWFGLKAPDEKLNNVEGVSNWLHDVQTIMYEILSASNIYQAMDTVYEEEGSFGTGCMMLVPDYNSVLRAETFTAGDYLLGYNHAGELDTFAREFQMQVAQVVEKFGLENCSDKVKNQYETKDFDSWVECKFLIEPNRLRLVGKKDAKNKKYRAVYWEATTAAGDKYLRESGYDLFPVLAVRWDTRTSRDTYGIGPGWDALGHAKQLQTMECDKLDAMNKIVNPPVVAPSSMQQGGIQGVPGGISWGNTTEQQKVVTLYDQNPQGIVAISGEIQSVEAKIRSIFFADLFLMLNQTDMPAMTAREVVERHEEKLLALGSVLERNKNDLHDPLIDLIFEQMVEVGICPPAPRELENVQLKVDYTSILAQAQKMTQTTAIREFTGYIGQAMTIKPEVVDKFNADEAATQYGKMIGLPPKIIPSDAEVVKIREQRAEAQAQQAQVEQAAMAIQGAQALSQTPTDGKTALSDLMGNQAAGGQ